MKDPLWTDEGFIPTRKKEQGITATELTIAREGWSRTRASNFLENKLRAGLVRKTKMMDKGKVCMVYETIKR